MSQTVAKNIVAERAPAISASQPADETLPLVSAIVSAYNSERFIRGCLEDLEAQTIADQMEIIVVDSGSRQNEWAIVKEFQQRYANIIYIRTAKREGIYAAWNRGIQAARGKYVTNANTDDRHKPDAFERMVAVLEAKPDIALVYADVYVTTTENETFESHTREEARRQSDFNALKLVYNCLIGPQPLWRMDMHAKYGYFDESFEVAGDWEFWLRMAGTETFFHLEEFLGLYLKSRSSAEHRNRELSRCESLQVHQRYLHRVKDAWSVASLTRSDMNHLIGFNDLKIGQRLKVRGKPGEDGAFVALEIIPKTPMEHTEIEGVIQSVDQQKNTLCLLNHEFTLPDGIVIKDPQRHIVSLQGLKAGDVVELNGKYSESEGFMVEKIKMRKSMDLGFEELLGDINKIAREKKALELAGFTVVVNDETIIAQL